MRQGAQVYVTVQTVCIHFSVLQCVAVCCSVLQCGCNETGCSSLGHGLNSMYRLQCVAVCCSVLQCVAVCCSVLQ